MIAILAFIALGATAISGFYPYAEVSGISRLWDHGGFMPNGFGAVLSAMLITMFSFMGAEIVTIAAAESDTPDKHIVRATNSVIWRISIFYLCSYFCGGGADPVEYAGSEKRRFVPFGTGAASYSARKIHYGLRDFVVSDQLSELRIIYRLPDALFP